jgi:hypothetical protein
MLGTHHVSVWFTASEIMCSLGMSLDMIWPNRTQVKILETSWKLEYLFSGEQKFLPVLKLGLPAAYRTLHERKEKQRDVSVDINSVLMHNYVNASVSLT